MQTQPADLRTLTRHALQWLALAMLLLAAGVAQAQVRLDHVVEFDIAPQSLDAALLQFSDQADLQVLVAAASLDGLDTRGFSGAAPAREALRSLLAGTGLTWRAAGDTITVIPEGNGGAQEASEPRPLALNGATSGTAAPEDDAAEARATEAVHRLRGITVTGSHIRGARRSPSPLLQFDREDIARTGYSTLAQFVESLPQNFGGGATQDAIGTEGSVGNRGFGNAPNLRGLGPGATLVLLNGQRLAPGGNSGQFIDVSMIPLSAIERVDVLTDGASAIYGADAVGGVINIVTRLDYEGIDTTVRYGNPTDGDAEEVQVSQSLATSWTSGNAMAVFEHFRRDALLAEDRDFASSADPTTTLLPEQERQSIYASATQDLGVNVSVFGSALYSQRESAHRQRVGADALLDRQDAENDQLYSSLGLRWEGGTGWSGELVTSYSDYSLDSRFDRAGEVTESTVDTDTRALDALANGALWELPAGDLSVALGAGYRKERVNTIFDDELPDRNVRVAFGELLIPLFGAANRRTGLEAMEISVAARYEDSSDFGDKLTPKYGLRWSPVEALSLRGTYGKSFKAPALAQLAGGTESFLAFIPSDFGFDVAGDPLIFARTQAGQPQLEAEESTNWTVGFDLQPEFAPFTLGVTYYDIDFTGRISDPVVGGFAEFFNAPDAFGDLIVQNPSTEFVNSLLAGATSFLDLTGGMFTPDAVGLYGDLAITNIAAERQSGVELNFEYPLETALGQFEASLYGTYITKFEKTVTPASPTVDADNVLYGPVDLRLRGGLTWGREQLTTSLFANYYDSYRVSNEADSDRIASWTTFDLNLRYALENTGNDFLDGLSMVLSVQNLFDRDPPFVAVPDFINANPGYDPTNADPLGRFMALSINKSW